jgi:hypothetical protein
MWQGFLALLALGASSGLTFLAYHHPTGFKRIYLPLVCAVWAVWLAWMIYGFAYQQGFSDAVLGTMKLNSPQIIKTPSSGSTGWWWYFVPAALYGYLSFLLYLPDLIRIETTGAPRGAENNDSTGTDEK